MCGGCGEVTHLGSVRFWANTSQVCRRRRAEPPSAALSPSCRQSRRHRRPPATWATHLHSLGSSAGTTGAPWGFRNTDAAARGEQQVSARHLLDEREEDLGHGAEIVLLAGVQHVTGAAQRCYFVHQVVLAALLQHHLQHLANAGLPVARLLQLGAAQKGESDRVQPAPTLLSSSSRQRFQNCICHMSHYIAVKCWCGKMQCDFVYKKK